MINQLTDLDELLLKTKGKHAREYLNEAIVSYRAGAYRAAVTSTWISICVDVIEKIRELAMGADAEAVNIEKRLNSIHSNDFRGMLDFENDILRIAHEDLGLISLIEKIHLERIKEDRNICAHPTFSIDVAQFVPHPEMARSYIAQASLYLLCQTPIRGKAILDNIFNLITSDSFPESPEKAFAVLKADQYLGRVKVSVYRNIIVILLKRLFKDPDSINESLVVKITSALFSIERLNAQEYRDTCMQKFTDILSGTDDTLLKRILPVISIKPDLWIYVSDAIKHRVEKVIKSMDAYALVKYRVTSASEKIHDIKEYFYLSIEDKDSDDLLDLIKGSPSILLIDKAIDIFINSGSFTSAYRNGVDVLLKYADWITVEHLKLIFDGTIKNSWRGINQITNAGGIGDVFGELFLKTKNIPKEQHNHMWVEFRDKLLDAKIQYQALDSVMSDDGIITV